jgi:hypothetical protein
VIQGLCGKVLTRQDHDAITSMLIADLEVPSFFHIPAYARPRSPQVHLVMSAYRNNLPSPLLAKHLPECLFLERVSRGAVSEGFGVMSLSALTAQRSPPSARRSSTLVGLAAFAAMVFVTGTVVALHWLTSFAGTAECDPARCEIRSDDAKGLPVRAATRTTLAPSRYRATSSAKGRRSRIALPRRRSGNSAASGRGSGIKVVDESEAGSAARQAIPRLTFAALVLIGELHARPRRPSLVKPTANRAPPIEARRDLCARWRGRATATRSSRRAAAEGRGTRANAGRRRDQPEASRTTTRTPAP